MRFIAIFFLIAIFSFPVQVNPVQANPIQVNPIQAEQKRIVMLGDSLTSGYGLQSGEDLATKLQDSLRAEGVNVKIDNAGVSGDTSSGGLARLDWAIAGEPKPALVIVALGANDMLRGINPITTRQNLTSILNKLQAHDIPVFLIGMKASLNMGEQYRTEFDAIYDDLAKQYAVSYYPFFLQGVAMNPDLNQQDGIHPNPKGVAVIVNHIAPLVKKAL